MSTGPWGTQSRKPGAVVRKAASSKVGQFVVTTLIVTALVGAALYGKYQSDRSSAAKHVPMSAYGQAVVLAQTCPVLRKSINAAMQDGYLTYGETRALRAAAEIREKAYVEAAARRDAAAAVGAPAVRTPLPCKNVPVDLFVFY